MEGIYDIYQGEDKIGKAEVRREGLYYRFICYCNLSGEVMHRIVVTCGTKKENLGIPIPDRDCFHLSTKLPVSRFTEDEPTFQVVPRHPAKTDGLWTPISPETPFAYIHKLQNAVLERRGDQIGILISEEVPQDSDPNP